MLEHAPTRSTPVGTLHQRTAADARRNLAARVREHRIRRGWTQRELASRAGVVFDTYRVFERTGRVSLDRFLRIADVLGVLDRIEIPAAPTARSIDDVLNREPVVKRQRVRHASAPGEGS